MIYREGIKGNIPYGYAGTFLDKIMVAQKGTQSYGTQYKVEGEGKDRKIIYYPIEDEKNLTKRRAAMGFTIPYKTYQSAVRNQFNR